MTLTAVPVQLVNKAAARRDCMTTLGVKLLPGEITNRATELRVTDGALEHRVQWEPFHETRHPDGSYQQIAVHFPAAMAANEERQVTISEGVSASQPTFALHASVASAAAGTTFALTIEGETRTVTLATVLATALDVTPLAMDRIGGATTAHLRRYVWRQRWTGVTDQHLRAIWWEIAFEAMAGKPVGKFYFSWGYSWCESGVRLGNPWNDKTWVLTTPARLTITGPGAFVHGENKKFNAITRVGNVTTFTLVDPDRFQPPETAYDYRHRNLTQGMCHHFAGELLFGSQAIPATDFDREGITAVAMDWPAKGIHPFGIVPDYPPTVPDRTEAIVRLREWDQLVYNSGRDVDPYFWGGTVGNANTGNTGDAGLYFGIMRFWLVMRAGYPCGLGSVLRDIRQEFCRPNHNRYPADDAPLWRYADFKPAAPPRLTLWNGVPFHLNEASRSEDMLGVNGPIGQLGIADWDCPQTQVNGAVFGWDRQHAMLMLESTVALLTADYSALLLFAAYEQVWLGNCDVTNPNEVVNENEVARAFARGIVRCGLDIFTVRGTQEVLDIVRTRFRYALLGTPAGGIDAAYQHSPLRPGTNFPLTMGGFDDIGPGKQAGNLPNVNHTFCWMDAMVAAYADAAAQLMAQRYPPNDQIAAAAAALAFDMALQTTLYGWLDARGLAPDRYRVIQTNMAVDEMSNAGVRTQIVGRIVTGVTSGATARVVGVVETDSTMALWVRDASGPFCTSGVENLTFAGSSFTCSALEDMSGFFALKARQNTPDYHPLSTVEWEATDEYEQDQPRAPGQLEAILACTKGVNPIVTLTPPGNPHYLTPTSVLAISNEPAWAALNGVWTIQIIDQQNVRLMGCDTSAMPGTYTPNPTVAVNRRLWSNRAMRPYRGYNIWLLPAAVLAREYAQRGVYGPTTGTAVGARVLARAQAIVDEFGAGRLLDVGTPTPPKPRWNDVDEHAAVRPNPFASTPQPPNPPTSLAANGIGPNSIRVTWQNATANVETDVQYRQVNAGAWIDAPRVGAGLAQSVVGGLAINTDYEFQIRSRLGVLVSAWVGPVSARTQGSPPNPPTNLAATGLTSGSIGVTWVNAATNADSIELDYRQVGAPTWTSITGLAPTTTARTLTGLLPATSYEVRVRARNGFGTSVWAGPVTATTLVGAPTAPTGLTATALSSSTAQLDWTNTDVTATSNEIRYRVVGTTPWTAGTPVAGNAITTTVSGLTPATAYEFEVRAVNGSGASDWAGPVSATTFETVPTAPTGLSVTGETSTSIVASWTNTATNATSLETQYQVAGAGTWTAGPTLAPTEAHVSIGGLTPATLYGFEIRAVNSAGASGWVGATGSTLAGAPGTPTGLVVFALSSSALRATWTLADGTATAVDVDVRRLGATAWTSLPALAGNATTVDIPNLAAGISYQVRVRARNGAGPSAWSATVEAPTNPGPPGKIAPAAPSSLRLLPIGSIRIDVLWTIEAINHAGHEVQFREINTLQWFPGGTVAGATATLSLTTGIQPSRIYEVRVRAFHEQGVSDWLVKTVSTGVGAELAVLIELYDLVNDSIKARLANKPVANYAVAGRALAYMSIPDLQRMRQDLREQLDEFSGPTGQVAVRPGIVP